MKKAEMKETILFEIKIWEDAEKEQTRIKKEALNKNDMTEEERAFREELRYGSMKHALALFAKKTELITHEEYKKIMEIEE